MFPSSWHGWCCRQQIQNTAIRSCYFMQVLEASTGIAISAILCYVGQQLAVAVGFPSSSISVITLLTVALATCFPTQLKPLVASSEGIAFILLQVCSSTKGLSPLHRKLVSVFMAFLVRWFLSSILSFADILCSRWRFWADTSGADHCAISISLLLPPNCDSSWHYSRSGPGSWLCPQGSFAGIKCKCWRYASQSALLLCLENPEISGWCLCRSHTSLRSSQHAGSCCFFCLASEEPSCLSNLNYSLCCRPQHCRRHGSCKRLAIAACPSTADWHFRVFVCNICSPSFRVHSSARDGGDMICCLYLLESVLSKRLHALLVFFGSTSNK